MTAQDPKPPRKDKPTRRPATALTLGDLLGAQIRGVQAQRARRAELDDMGFRPVGEKFKMNMKVDVPKGWPGKS